jgi:hypothetical protein
MGRGFPLFSISASLGPNGIAVSKDVNISRADMGWSRHGMELADRRKATLHLHLAKELKNLTDEARNRENNSSRGALTSGLPL